VAPGSAIAILVSLPFLLALIVTIPKTRKEPHQLIYGYSNERFTSLKKDRNYTSAGLAFTLFCASINGNF
jgi:hypothetical protein